MNLDLDPLVISSRWIHVLCACAVIGASFFFAFLLPAGLAELDPPARETFLARVRRGFKMTVHVSLLLFLITGIYNAVRSWPIYTKNPGVMHGLFGMHFLLGLAGVTVLMVMLAGKQPKPARARWARGALGLLVIAVLMASTLKSAREWTMTHPAAASAATAR